MKATFPSACSQPKAQTFPARFNSAWLRMIEAWHMHGMSSRGVECYDRGWALSCLSTLDDSNIAMAFSLRFLSQNFQFQYLCASSPQGSNRVSSINSGSNICHCGLGWTGLWSLGPNIKRGSWHQLGLGTSLGPIALVLSISSLGWSHLVPTWSLPVAFPRGSWHAFAAAAATLSRAAGVLSLRHRKSGTENGD